MIRWELSGHHVDDRPTDRSIIPCPTQKHTHTNRNDDREFQYYTNNRTNSFVEDGVLYLQPTLTENTIGEENVRCAFRYVCVYVYTT